MAPAKGWPIPHNRFCRASEKAKTSRPQPFSCDIGVRKNPSDERGPNDRTEIRQPQIAMTATLRAVTAGRIRSAMDISMFSLSVFNLVRLRPYLNLLGPGRCRHHIGGGG